MCEVARGYWFDEVIGQYLVQCSLSALGMWRAPLQALSAEIGFDDALGYVRVALRYNEEKESRLSCKIGYDKT
jgi:hypothetical protein